MPRKKKSYYIERQAKRELKLEQEKIEEIERRLLLPKDPQRKLIEFSPRQKKDTEYWIKYNRARTDEKRLFYMLLDELLNVIPEPKKSNGRPSFPTRDLIFCACIKLYNGFSARRISSDMDHAHRMGFITKTPHFNTLLNFMKDPTSTEIIKYLITLSAMPLSCIEKEFAMDASGFGSYQYERWMRVRFGNDATKRGWRNYVKCHISVGVLTHIITAAEVTYGTMSDHNQLPYLAKQTSRNFTAHNYLADKAYCSRKNFEIIEKLNALPIIPFKSNATGKKRGCPIWNAMYNYFHNNQKSFKFYYGQRSQSESCFSMIKRTFGEFLKSKTFEAQRTEVLLKCLCHNIACLISQLIARNIEINFDICKKKIINTKNPTSPIPQIQPY